MSDDKSGESKRYYVQFKVTEAEADHFSKLFLLRHADLKPQNVILAEGLRDVDVIINMVDSYPQTPPIVDLAPAIKQSKPKLEIAPGFRLHGWLSSLCPRSFRENVLDECLADGTLLYQERLAAGDLKGARRAKWVMHFCMLRAMFGGFITGALWLVAEIFKSSN